MMNFRLDVFNFLDNDASISVDEVGEFATGEANPTYGETIEYQSPRRVRLGVGLGF